MIISTHSPARGLTSLTNMIPRTPIYFNSQPRKGADRAGALLNSITVISTHSPARGLTVEATLPKKFIIFQLTAPQGG